MTALTSTLTREPALRLLPKFIGLDIGSFARRLMRALGVQRPRDLGIDDMQVPDSALVREATALVEKVSPTYLFNHVMRSYLFGYAIALNIGLKPDWEVFYFAALMHDLGLVGDYEDKQSSFELNGARAAHAFLRAHDYPEYKADIVHEAIALHARVGVAPKHGPEAALVHYGAGLDVIEFRKEDVSDITRQTIVTAYPRAAFKENFVAALRRQTEMKSNCNIAGHIGLGFDKKINSTSFSE